MGGLQWIPVLWEWSHPSHEQFMLSVWMHPPAASHGIFIAVPASGVPNPLGHALKASSLQRTAQKFGNCHCPVINLPFLAILWIYIARLIHLWFTPLCLCSLLMISLPRQSLAPHLSSDMSWHRGPHTHHLQLPRRWICTDTECTHFFAEIICGHIWIRIHNINYGSNSLLYLTCNQCF